MINEYITIIKQIANSISGYFTNITSSINGTKYEFPSDDIHKAIIDKLMFSESSLFNQLMVHLTKEYEEVKKKRLEEQMKLQNKSSQTLLFTSGNPVEKFIQVYEQFNSEVRNDLNKKKVEIDKYINELQSKAVIEYNELCDAEKEMIEASKNNNSDNDSDFSSSMALNEFYGFCNCSGKAMNSKERKKLKKKRKKEQKKTAKMLE